MFRNKKLRELRRIWGMSQDELAQEVGVTKEYISMIESGKRVPGLKVLSNLANLFKRQPSDFIREEESPFSVHFRATELKENEEMEINKAMQLVKNWAFLEEITENKPQLSPAYSGPPESNIKYYWRLIHYAEEMANSERNRLKLGCDPIDDIFSLISEQGLHIVRQNLNSEGLDAFFLFDEDKGAFCIINTMKRTLGRQRFSAVHEYCHYLKDRREGYHIDRYIFEDIKGKPNEKIANMFASAFLMPKEEVISAVNTLAIKSVSAYDVIFLKRYFGVSYLAMLYRLYNLDKIKKKRLEELKNIQPYKLEKEFFGNIEEDEKEYEEKLPERYLHLALMAYTDGKISLGKLSELTGVNQFTLEDILKDISIGENE